ncbi:MAG: pyruvate ferredoxin oxidoreductase subunit gamma [Archaeoglobaceae archaeon]|nr:pyruvate ferredoxin oxidoreductase subunit gamma [Archaeoglobaceae archaeon]
MNMLIEVRFHGRGGQGVVTAADFLAVAGFKEGYYTLSFPTFGPEKRGTPVASFLRLSDEPIVIRDEIYRPDYVVVLDPSIFGSVNVLSGLKSNGMLIANYPKGSEDLRAILKIDKAFTINATKFAINILGRPITNTAMVGAFAGATGILKLKTLKETADEFFDGTIAERNKILIEETYKYMREVCR